ncbi:MAG: hypothetical protein Q8L57_02760 [bacterium]|nr:hypothetical protein [bacterium]
MFFSAFFCRSFWRDKIVVWGLVSALFLNLSLWVLIYIRIPVSDIPSVLHYTIYRGIGFLGEGSKIYDLALISLVLIVFNLIFADFFYRKEKIISYLFILAASGLTLFLLMAAINLIIVNG